MTWLSDDEQRVWRRFAAVLELLPQALDAQLPRDADISHFSYWIMAMLSERSLVFDPLTPAQVDQLGEISTALRGKLVRRGT